MADPRAFMRAEMMKMMDQGLKLDDVDPLSLMKRMHAPIWDNFRCADPNYRSAAAPPTCSEECPHCSDQFLPNQTRALALTSPIQLHSDEQARSEIQDLVSAINSNITQMRKMIENYGDTISSRWKKRKPNKREIMLLKVKPDMCLRKNEEAHFSFESLTQAKLMEATKIEAPCPLLQGRDAALTPYLDIPTLREEPLKLLALMHYRATASPSDWILFDCRQMRHSFHIGRCSTAYNPHCVVALGSDFGKLVQWDKNSAHKWDMIGYTAGRLALKGQRSLTDFLRKMMELLLEGDLSHATKGCVAWKKLVRQGFKVADSDGTVWAYSDSVFSAPPKFDIKRVVDLFAARRNAAEDDLWLLQTDPLYLRQFVDRFNASSLHRQLSHADRGQLLSELLLGNVRRLSFWNTLLEEAERIADITAKLDQEDNPDQDLTKEYEDALSLLESGIKFILRSQAETLLMWCAALPSFQHHFAANGDGKLKLVTQPIDSFYSDPLLWNITELQLSDHDLSKFPSYHIANIDEIISKSSLKERTRIDQRVLDHLSDMAAVEEAMAGIRNHRSRLPVELLDRGEKAFLPMVDFGQADMFDYYVTRSREGADGLWERLEDFCRLPIPSSHATADNFARTLALHLAQENYWREVYKIKGRLLKRNPWFEPYAARYLDKISMGFTEEHKNNVQDALKTLLLAVVEKEKAQQPPAVSTTKSTSEYRWSTDSHIGTFATQVVPKTKIKTRPQEEPSKKVDQLSIADSSSVLGMHSPRIAVSEVSVGLFQRMFSSVATSVTRWNELVAALSDAGFSATSNGGSAVNFKDEQTGQGAIVFHRPHPDSRIDPEMLRGFGKRLNKWFGWDEDTFVVRSK